MKKLLVLLCFVCFSGLSYAEESDPVGFNMDAFLKVNTPCLSGFCMDLSMNSPISFKLLHRSTITSVEDNGKVRYTTLTVTHRGFYSQVVEKDGHRYIGIVTIERQKFIAPDIYKMPLESFTLRLEIFNDSGRVAELSSYFSKASDVPSVTLKSPDIVTRTGAVFATFSIGPGSVVKPFPLQNVDYPNIELISGELAE
ncbi:MAG: hypothetical protein HOE90_04725 [Bacteriovoracaceae bacterium]|jgi:hypothetical protein|nr:hypothetical protein [Bacteriovoracaceae bacterium]